MAQEDADTFLDQSVDEIRENLPGYDGDLETLLEKEKNGENRETAKQAIRQELQRRTETSDAAASEAEDIHELLDGSVAEVKEALKTFDGDLKQVLEQEKQGQDRKTLERYLKHRLKLEQRNAAEDGETGKEMAGLKQQIEAKLRGDKEEARSPEAVQERIEEATTEWGETHVRTGITGFDELFRRGVPKGAPILVAGGAGSGKTIFCLQTLAHHAANGKNCFYMSFEESTEKLKNHMRDFGWNPDELEQKGNLKMKRYSPFDITRQVEAMLAKEKGELLIDVEPVLLPEGFNPDFVALDSLTALSSAFTGQSDSYRIYIEQLFRFFEEKGITTFLISETEQEPEQFSPTGVEEFLADGVFVIYNFRRGDVRERAIEVLKMRGESHEKNIVAMQITDQGIKVYPDQEVFSAMS